MSSFRIGQKVVCVDDSPGLAAAYPGWWGEIRRGRVYTIRAFDGPAIMLEEVQSRIHPDFGIECSFYIWRFRPAVDKPADISIFRKMLEPSKKEDRIDA